SPNANLSLLISVPAALVNNSYVVFVFFMFKRQPREIQYFQRVEVCEKEPKQTTIEDIENYYNILKTTGVHLKKMENLKPQDIINGKTSFERSNVNDDTTMKNEPFYFNPEANSTMVTDPAVENMFNFTLTPQPKKGSGLYKDVIPQTQLVYYNDPYELVTRLNLLTSSRKVLSIANELHRPARKIFSRRSVVTRFNDDLWQADLMDMQSHSRQNYGFKYILVIIDTYSNYVWVEALKNKTSKECTNSIFNILKKAHPKLLQTDNGTEFYNIQFRNLMKKYKIKHYSSYSVIKCSMAERVLQTLKNNIYINILLQQNNQMLPNEARMDTNKIKFNTQFNDTLYKPKLKVNDKEIKLTDFPDTFLVEHIIKKVGNKMFVKWLGFDSSPNSWITSSDILK
ncbi:Integrase catalytic domain-containing protein, partial [Aphis craccivora]